jgi:hypothetical protein
VLDPEGTTKPEAVAVPVGESPALGVAVWEPAAALTDAVDDTEVAACSGTVNVTW